MRELISALRPGILTYGITPPKRSYTRERLAEVAARQTDRIGRLPVDGLVVYDLQDEPGRTDAPRPFPYSPCIDPTEYALDALGSLTLPKIVYRCVAPLSEGELSTSLQRLERAGGLCVLVGAASRRQKARMSLHDAYALARERHPTLPLGGVLIAERHERSQAEHERALHKMDSGCRFFVTQAVYSVVATKNLLSDLCYRCQAEDRAVPPVLVTLTPCGSLRTLEFLRWLGVSVPRWLENDLRHARDILEASVEVCSEVLADLQDFASSRGIPLGCNVESVSLAKVEIEASAELARRAARCLGRPER